MQNALADEKIGAVTTEEINANDTNVNARSVL
jgi:hypothetical protein